LRSACGDIIELTCHQALCSFWETSLSTFSCERIRASKERVGHHLKGDSHRI
jgi:hypothetical protein